MPFKNARQKHAGRRVAPQIVNKRKRIDEMGKTSKRAKTSPQAHLVASRKNYGVLIQLS